MTILTRSWRRRSALSWVGRFGRLCGKIRLFRTLKRICPWSRFGGWCVCLIYLIFGVFVEFLLLLLFLFVRRSGLFVSCAVRWVTCEGYWMISWKYYQSKWFRQNGSRLFFVLLVLFVLCVCVCCVWVLCVYFFVFFLELLFSVLSLHPLAFRTNPMLIGFLFIFKKYMQRIVYIEEVIPHICDLVRASRCNAAELLRFHAYRIGNRALGSLPRRASVPHLRERRWNKAFHFTLVRLVERSHALNTSK